jgi:hypothetical protein
MNNQTDTILRSPHILKFTLREVILLTGILVTVIAFFVSSHYDNVRRHESTDRLDAIQSSDIEVMKRSVIEIRDRQAEEIGILKVMKDDQGLMLNKLMSIGNYQQQYRPFKSERSNEKETK